MRGRAAVAVAAAVFGVAGGALAAPTPISVVREVMAAAPGRMPESVRCVPTRELPMARGSDYSRRASGVTTRRGTVATVLLDWRHVCNPLYRFRMKRRVEPAAALQALMTLLHEHAHVQGVRTEWKANCTALPWVLRQVRRWGYNKRQVDAVTRYVTIELDKGRPAEYKVTGRCVNARR